MSVGNPSDKPSSLICYAEATEFETYPARRQDTKNRQNSIDDLPLEDKAWFILAQNVNNMLALKDYQEALERGIAKEQARMLLPLSTRTRLYMTGNIRCWITYCQLRCKPGTQLEHREIADACKAILLAECPELEAAFEPAAV